ncbi:MAG: hypothetical protein CME61_03490 [Halobacteriovoraceae bacterium]|nr:hypothetical protein [Halobacteriovoraceae bacterium]
MKKKTLLGVFLGLLMSANSYSCDIDGKTGIVEDNPLWITADQKSLNGITEETFNEILDKVEDLYTPIIEEFGATLDVVRNWESGTVNAYARQIGTSWQISMFGGLARHETITADAFALVACHELGHHIGGAPKKASYWGSSWASNEGQSDYWGAMKCMRRYMEDDNNEEIVANMEVDEYAREKCTGLFESNPNELAMCIRNSMAGLSLGNLFRALRRSTVELKFDTPDPNVVSQTNHNHPAPQCRLDTYFAGSICDKSYDDVVSQTDPNQGVCTREAELPVGARPLCWYKPSLDDDDYTNNKI